MPKKKVSKKKATDKEKCFHCNADGDWKRNYSDYLASLKNKKDNAPLEDMLDLLVIETNLIIFSAFNWIIDSSSSAHLYIST